MSAPPRGRANAAAPPDAVEQVLAAERAAEREVLEAHAEAERRIAAARTRAAAVARRADDRIQRLSIRCAAAADAEIDRLRREHRTGALASRTALTDDAVLALAVERVVDWLLGDEPPAPGPRP